MTHARRHDERRGETLRLLQDGQPGVGDLGDLMRIMTLRKDLAASPAKRIAERGREEAVEALAIRETQGETIIG